MSTKTFKIGEYCSGGIITVETHGDKVTIINKEWDFSKGSRKSSDQSKAKVLFTDSFDASLTGSANRIEECLLGYTTSYHAGEVMKHIRTKVKLN